MAVVVTVTGVIIMCIGMAIIGTIVWFRKCQRKNAATSAEIDLKLNEAYGPVRRTSTKPNKEYETVQL